MSKSVHQIVDDRIMRHSQKPDSVRKRIVELFGDLPRIELFARELAEGWDSWGDEIGEETRTLRKGARTRKRKSE